MEGPAPKTRGWHAHENSRGPRGWHLIVGGVVEVGTTNKEPRLSEAPERNPKNLGLKLTIETSPGEGADVIVWKVVHFYKEVRRQQYDQVVIRWNAEQIGHCRVFDDAHYAVQADAAMKSLNQKYASPENHAAKKPPAKKVSAKKAGLKRKSAAKKKRRAAASRAKGKKGEVPRRAARKPGSKKLVRKLARKLWPAKKKV